MKKKTYINAFLYSFRYKDSKTWHTSPLYTEEYSATRKESIEKTQEMIKEQLASDDYLDKESITLVKTLLPE